MGQCTDLENCSFFDKHGAAESAVFALLISIYCNGPLRDECARKLYLNEKGSFPAADVAPTGLNLSAAQF